MAKHNATTKPTLGSRLITAFTAAIIVLSGGVVFYNFNYLVPTSADAVSNTAAVPPKLTEKQVDELIAAEQIDAGYSSLSPEARATWNGVATTLYRKLKAYNLRFELTNDPEKNCSQKESELPGGCYHSGGAYDQMIFISPEGIGPDALDFIVFHEYSHHLQQLDGGNRFSSNKECDADLRALELRGSFSPGVKDQCAATGMDTSKITPKSLPGLEAKFAASKSK